MHMFINVSKRFKTEDLLLYGTLRRLALLKVITEGATKNGFRDN